MVVEVADRFGDYGLVGVMLFECSEDSLNVDTFLLSCRALGRGVEHRMLAQLGRIAVERGLRSVAIRFTPTERNRPMLDFLQAVGAKYSGDAAYLFPSEYAAALTHKPQGAPAPEAVQPVRKGRAKRPANSMQWTRIARQFREAGQILAEIRSHHSTHAEQRAHYTAPRTPAERILAEIWAELLGLAQVGVHDNFFDLGGHSLLAVQILSRVREAFQVELSLNVVFNGVFTVAELSKAIELAQIEQAGPESVDSMLDELSALSDEEVKALLMEEGDWAASQE